ncbi:MAG: glycosyltransferase [Candidatus Omnitrophica bacterium]|nr:glycosyltransferase [Candidatus Omnitrophota bacterium]
MKRPIVTMFVIWAFVFIGSAHAAYMSNNAPAASTAPKMTGMMMCGTEEIKLKVAMRSLWDDHVEYTREYIISALAGLEDVNAVAERLLRNQDDIGNAIKPYYGNDAGQKLTALLKDHIMIATDVVKAAKAGNNQQVEAAQARWKANAEEIAVFLSGANPNWQKKDLSDMLAMHLDLTTKEAVSRINKDWNADIAYYDEGHDHMMKFADVLTGGIVKQFPDKFKV